MVGIEEDSVRYAHSGPSQRFLRGLRPLVSVGPLPLPVSAGGHASSTPTINPPELLPPQKKKTEADFESASRFSVTYYSRSTVMAFYNGMVLYLSHAAVSGGRRGESVR